MRINEVITESFNKGNYQVNDVTFDIKQHAIDRLEERHVPATTAKEMLRRVANDILGFRSTIDIGEPFWVHDDTLGISMGLRLLGSGRVMWATTIIGMPKNTEGRYPVIDLST